MSTKFGADSSGCFPFKSADTDAHTLT